MSPLAALGLLLILPFAQDPADPAQPSAPRERVRVELEEEQAIPIVDLSFEHVLARPWYESIDVSGFGAVGYLDSGNAGTRPDGGFLIKESSLFVEADAWEDAAFFAELQVNRLGKDDSLFVRTGEVYLHFYELAGKAGEHGEGTVNMKIGRVDIPFGEEYLWQDAPDNPLITQSAAYPYGFDEGVLLYGAFSEATSWVTSLTDGTDKRSDEDNPAKAVTAKIAHQATESVYLSASAMVNGDAAKSAFEFGGSHFEPVSSSSVGGSASTQVDARLWQVDAVIDVTDRAELALFYGQAAVDDADSTYDRDLSWFMVQPRFELTPQVYAAVRYSEIGTYDDDEGYHFDGKILAGGNGAFGYDAQSLRRLSVGLGWQRNENTLFKFEIGKDWFDLIDASSLDEENSDRLYFGFEAVLSF